MSGYATMAFRKILQEERQWSACYLNTLRAVGISLFVTLQLAVYGPTRGTYVLLVYGLVAWGVFFRARVSRKVCRWSTLAVPFLDMPAVFLKQWLDLGLSTAPRALATFSIGLFMLLIMLSAFTLRNRMVLFSGLLAVGLQSALEWGAGDTPIGKAGSILALILTAVVCEVALSERIRLAHRLADEQLRLEKLSRYFSPQVAATIETAEEPFGTGQSCEITVLFSDLRGFTTATENASPGEVLELLNDFHSHMVEVIFAHEGTLDKYIGDGLMAYFGAPLKQPDHAERAIRCAQAMQSAVREINARRTAQGQPPLQLSIGVHTGPAVVGAIGAANRREFTAVGDTVNVAARIENLTREYGNELLLSAATARRVGPDQPLRPIAQVRLKGRTEAVELFAPSSGGSIEFIGSARPGGVASRRSR